MRLGLVVGTVGTFLFWAGKGIDNDSHISYIGMFVRF